MQVKKQQLEPNKKQWTGSKEGKEYIKGCILSSAYLTFMQSTSCEMLGRMNHRLKSRLPGEISTTSYANNATVMAESEEELEPLDEGERNE